MIFEEPANQAGLFTRIRVPQESRRNYHLSNWQKFDLSSIAKPADRIDHSAERAGAGDQGDPMIAGRRQRAVSSESKQATRVSRIFVFACLLLAVFLPAGSVAQQPQKVLRIGFISSHSPSAIAARIEAFRDGLRSLGYVDGKNIVLEYRSAEGKLDRLPDLAAELVHLKVDVMVTSGPPATRSVKEKTSSIPIVMAFDTDPVGNGFVASLARPGGNVAGLSALSPEISGKRLELLKEIVPRLSRLAVLGQSTEPANAQSLKEMELAARPLGVKLQYVDVPLPSDIEVAFQAAKTGRADAIFVLGGHSFNSQLKQVAEFANKNRLPAAYQGREYVEAGGLMSYGTNIPDLFRRAGVYVDKIFKGAKPADLPVEQPTKFEFVVNLKTARQIGLKIPPNVLARADRVIK
jgi:putative ABC transport system substrate-binding protein